MQAHCTDVIVLSVQRQIWQMHGNGSVQVLSETWLYTIEVPSFPAWHLQEQTRFSPYACGRLDLPSLIQTPPIATSHTSPCLILNSQSLVVALCPKRPS